MTIERTAQEGLVLQELSNAMVGLYKELFGRGPTRTRSNFAGPDVVLCSLEGTLTPAEQRLVDMGEHQRLRDTRIFFQYASEQEFIGAAERITNRKVRAFISGIDVARDVACEIFYLEPQN
jgi:uncharacterized protein YbcI